METIAAGERFRSRVYRNRRLGEFLKELDLSEGHSTGVPTIQEELKKNGSPRAKFYTDESRRALRVEIPVHPDFIAKKADIGKEKADIGEEKADIEKLKPIYRKKLKQGGFNKTTFLRVDVLLQEVKAGQVFGRKEVVQALKISPAAASAFLSKMKDAGIIIAVSGHGKGKYQLNTENPNDS